MSRLTPGDWKRQRQLKELPAATEFCSKPSLFQKKHFFLHGQHMATRGVQSYEPHFLSAEFLQNLAYNLASGCVRYFLDALWIPQHQRPKIMLTPTTSRVSLPTTPRPSAAAAHRLSADGDFQRDAVDKPNHHPTAFWDMTASSLDSSGLSRSRSRQPSKVRLDFYITCQGNSHFWWFFPARTIGIIPLSLKSLSVSLLVTRSDSLSAL